MQNWFRCFKNNDFDVEKEHSGALKQFEDEDLEALLDEDSYQVQAELAESLRMIQKQGHWVLYELKLRDVKQHFIV